MPERTLVAIHDPRRTRAREGSPAGLPRVRRAGSMTAAWTGDGEPSRGDVLTLVDGDVTVSRAWATAWTAALAGLRTLRGAFAIVLWDERAERGVVARDHLGARPLFWATNGSALYVASEIGPLLAALPQRPPPDLDEVARRLAGRRGEHGATLFTGVRELAPAHALLLDGSGWRIERYWWAEPRRELAGADRLTAANALRDGVGAAVRRHVACGAGVLVSGGLDSSTILACADDAARTLGQPAPRAFSGVPERRELDESAFVDALGAHLAIDVERVPLPGGPIVPRAMTHLERWELPLEHPGGAFFLPVQEAAAARGAVVVLDGEGGDELFGCEPLLIADRLLAGNMRDVVALVRSLPGMTRLDARSLRVVLRRWVLPGVLPLTVLRRLRAARRPPIAPWLGPAARSIATASADDRWREAPGPRWQSHLAWLLTDARAALGVHDHLRRVAALAGVRDVHPFLDVDLIELVLGLPPELAFNARLDRPLLRAAMRGLLPDSVRLREDKVFFDELLLDALTGPDRPAVERTLSSPVLELGNLVDSAQLREAWSRGPSAHAAGPAAWSIEMWRAFALETWLRREAGDSSVSVFRNATISRSSIE